MSLSRDMLKLIVDRFLCPLSGMELLRLRTVSKSFLHILNAECALSIEGILWPRLLVLVCSLCRRAVSFVSRPFMDADWSLGKPPFELRTSGALRKLSLRDVDMCEDVDYLQWVNVDHLTDFTLIAPLGPPDSFVPGWRDRSEYQQVFSVVKMFTNLEHFCLGSWMQFGGGGLLSVLQVAGEMPKLKSLTIPRCYSRLSADDYATFSTLLKLVFAKCKELKSLRLLFCGLPEHNHEAWALTSFGLLEDLALSEISLRIALPTLKSLRLYSTNTQIKHIPDWELQFPALESLHLVEDDDTAILVSLNSSFIPTGTANAMMSIANLKNLR